MNGLFFGPRPSISYRGRPARSLLRSPFSLGWLLQRWSVGQWGAAELGNRWPALSV